MNMSKISVLCCFMVVAFGVVINGQAQEIKVYELQKDQMSVKFTNWGARIISLVLPDKTGALGDIVLGYDSLIQYRYDYSFFGAVVGRVANRIAGAKFTLNGIEYQLGANAGNNTLHGGRRGFHKVLWTVTKYETNCDSPTITFTYLSPDGDEGFPGELLVSVTYTISNSYNLQVVMEATAQNQATPVNLAQHTYWNLGGHNSGDILSEEIRIFASNITPLNMSTGIPTGQIACIKDTPYDFLEPQVIETKMKELPKEYYGYDINYVVDGDNDKMKPVAEVSDKRTGRVMKLSSNAPGVQFYTGNGVQNAIGKGGYVYQIHAGLCLETQGFPDAVNHPNFPSQIIFPGKAYRHEMLYEFQ